MEHHVDDETTPDSDLETISISGTAPKSRLSSSTSAWNIHKQMVRSDAERSRKRAIVQGQIDGNRPYDQSELVRLGQANRSNVNFRDAEGIKDARKTSYYELLMEVETLVDVKTPTYFSQEDPDAKWGDVIAEKFSEMLMEWPNWWYHMMLHQEQMVTWGVGNLYWDSDIDWRFKSARIGSFLVPDETKTTLEDFEVIDIRDSYRVHDLFQYVKDPETTAKAADDGWNVTLLRRLIRKAAKAGTMSDSLSIGDWESMQAKIKANDIEFSYGGFDTVKIAHMFVKEFDGKISHFIISEDSETYSTTNGYTSSDDNFLFKQIGKYENWNQVICLFVANVGEGTYHSVRGLGAKIFAHCQISDRLKNTIVDGAMASATILLQPNNEGQRERVRLVRFGPFSVMPNGYSVIPDRTHNPNLEGLVGVESLVQSNLNRNVGMYRPDVVEDEKTPQGQNQMELRNRASKEAKLEKSDIHIYYVQWDMLYNELFRRVLNPHYTSADPGYEQVKKFLDACKDAGVPAELMKADKLSVKARRALGYGSPVMRSMISADILSISPYFDERGKHNAVRDYVHARAGSTGVERYIPGVDRNQIPTTQHTLAGLENNDMIEGADVIVGVDQPHVIHVLVHMQPMIEQAQAFISGEFQGDPAQLYAYLQVGIGHCAKHLDFLADDPAHENEYQMLSGQLEQLAKVLSMVEGVVKQQAKQREKEAQQQEEIMRQAAEMAEGKELQVELQKLQMDFALRAEKERGIQAVREAKAKHGMMIDEMLAKSKMETR